jgi:tRNA pseudouridine38-40 synthase
MLTHDPFFIAPGFHRLDDMPRFKLTIEYEGTRYSGWQIQKNARTVQGEIEEALRTVLKTDSFEFLGSGRTDAGVHALGQMAHLEAPTVLAPHILRMKVNDELPPDINILDIRSAPPRFHARHNAFARSYLYQISRRRTAFGKRFVWWVNDDLHAASMRSAAELFTGMQDLRSFTDDDPEKKSTRVLLEEIELREAGDLILVRVVGSHFLWKSVRRIVGVIVEAGKGNLGEAEIRELLKTHSSTPAGLTAPPSGLFLEKVYYEEKRTSLPIHPVIAVTHERQ